MKIWFQNRRMKWKRSKKAQQEAKAKAAADRAAKLNGTKVTQPPTENKSKRITEEDEIMSSDHEDEDIDVGEDSDPCMPSPPIGGISPNIGGMPHIGVGSIPSSTPNLITPTPILGLPHPPALQLRPLLAQPPMIRPPTSDSNLGPLDPSSTSLSALLPAHLARLSQAATGGNRLYRPFVA